MKGVYVDLGLNLHESSLPDPLGPGLDSVGIEARRQVALKIAADALAARMLGRALRIVPLTNEDKRLGRRGARIAPEVLAEMQTLVERAVRPLDCGWRVRVEPVMSEDHSVVLSPVSA